MRTRWKLLGLAGAAGVAATGVAVAKNRRPQGDYTPDEMRAKLRDRLAEAEAAAANGGVNPLSSEAGAPPA
jgi:hypothetical protein